MISPIRFQPRYGGPAVTLHDDGTIEVDGHGFMTLSKWATAVDGWRDLIRRNADKHGLPEAWIASVMHQESQGNANASTADGGTGLMQLTSPTLFHGHKRSDLFDPELNVDYGSEYLRTLSDKYSWNPIYVAAAYNSGSVYQWTGRNCASPGLWNLQTACSYCENIVRGINTAISRGYSGIGASGTPSVWPKLLAFSVVVAAVGGVVILHKSRRQ